MALVDAARTPFATGIVRSNEEKRGCSSYLRHVKFGISMMDFIHRTYRARRQTCNASEMCCKRNILFKLQLRC